MALQASSSFRRSGQRDDRRRRLLADELSNPSDWPERHVCSEAALTPQKSTHYGDAEFLGQQLRLLDLIPRRTIGFVSLLVVGAAILAGLETSYAWMLDRVAGGGGAITALNLAVKGSLGCWFTSLLLLTAAAAAFLIYSVRRHRTDDYQGRYRIWLWAAACWFLMATDQAASLREAFRDLMTTLTGTSLAGDGSLWWAIFYAFALGAIGSRVFMDMRSSRPSMGFLATAAIAHGLAMAGRQGWILLDDAGRQVMWIVGAEIAGSLLLLTAMTLYARHVLLDAEGLLPCNEPEPAEMVEEEALDDEDVSPASANDRWTKVDPPHATLHPVFRPSAPAASASPPSSAPIHSPVNRKLTKDEKRALKARLLRERADRERRGL